MLAMVCHLRQEFVKTPDPSLCHACVRLQVCLCLRRESRQCDLGWSRSGRE